MKRMTVCGLAVLSIALLAAGCDEPSAIPRRPTFEWSIVEFNGHTYVKWTGYKKGGIVHDPDCKCSRDDKANAEAVRPAPAGTHEAVVGRSGDA